MTDHGRRRFLRLAAAIPAALSAGCSSLPGKPCATPQVVVVGGGFGGATAAKYLRLLEPDLRITLIEPKAIYQTCPGSNWLFAGIGSLDRLSVNYSALRDRHRIEIIADSVSSINTTARRLTLAGGASLRYDRLLLAPGIDFRFDFLPGYAASLSERFPHAWQAGPQTLLLWQQLQSMPAGGVVLMTVPAEPYRCPPGPYERASLIACWLQRHNPRAKLLILDAKTSFSKQKLFEAAWRRYFGYGTDHSLLEWHSLADNPLSSLDAASGTLRTDFGDSFRGDVLNIIPPQQAAILARETGLADAGGWCPVQALTAESSFAANLHLLGDAARYAPIPKSAFAANSEAKACALAVASLLRQQPPPAPEWLNTCYSLVTAEHGISVAGVYRLNDKQEIAAVNNAGGLSNPESPQQALLEAGYAQSVYRSLVADSFG